MSDIKKAKNQKTRKVMVGDVPVGGGNPVSIQSMTNTDTRNVVATVSQIRHLEEAGCQIIRVAVPDEEAAAAIEAIKKEIHIPLVADIHFDHRLALLAMKAGADKIRINPGNVGGRDKVAEVVKEAKARSIPLRVGVNSGSLPEDIRERDGGVTAKGLVDSALRQVEILSDLAFEDVVISIKSSDVPLNTEAYRLLASATDCPLHIGVTEAGTPGRGRIKSAVGLGSLLLEGIGDTMRVSLTGDPADEVILARQILEAAGERKPAVEFISCPTCGRTQVDLMSIAEQVEKRVERMLEQGGSNAGDIPPITCAIMGCEVNGPGEAKDADIGIACGKGQGAIFLHGEILKTVPEEKLVDELETVLFDTFLK